MGTVVGFRDLRGKDVEAYGRLAAHCAVARGSVACLGRDPRCVTAAPFRRFPIHFGSYRSVDVCIRRFRRLPMYVILVAVFNLTATKSQPLLGIRTPIL